jgi:hypothetical protein
MLLKTIFSLAEKLKFPVRPCYLMSQKILLVLLLLVLLGASAFAYDWNCETVESKGEGRHLDIAFGPDGNAHIAYMDWGSNYDFHYCTGAYGNWSCEAP